MSQEQQLAAQNNWYVITGAPHSGKSTIIKLLQKKSYQIRDEAARILIDSELAKGRALSEIRANELDFQRQVLKMKIKMEEEADSNQIIFWDRGIPDSEAYYRLIEAKLDKILVEANRNCQYKKVFLMDYFPYHQDYARVESELEQVKRHHLLEEAYQKIKTSIIKVPVMESDEDRFNFILNNL